MPRLGAAEIGGQNVCAFLDMIAVSEIGAALLAKTDDGYNVLVGSTPDYPILMDNYDDHPNVYNAKMNSDAAGRYQIMHCWWPYYAKLLNLHDFSPESQDRYAVRQIYERHAIPMIQAGDIASAIHACSNIWASLPGAGYGQHENKLFDLIKAYTDAGGELKTA